MKPSDLCFLCHYHSLLTPPQKKKLYMRFMRYPKICPPSPLDDHHQPPPFWSVSYTKARCGHPHLVGFDLSWDASIATRKLRVLRCQLPSARRYHHGRHDNLDLNWEKKGVKTSSAGSFLGEMVFRVTVGNACFSLQLVVFLRGSFVLRVFREYFFASGGQQGMRQVAIHNGRCSVEITDGLYLSSQIEIDVRVCVLISFGQIPATRM